MGRHDARYCTPRDDGKYVFFWHYVGHDANNVTIIVDYMENEHGEFLDADLSLMGDAAREMVGRVHQTLGFDVLVSCATSLDDVKRYYPLNHFNDFQAAFYGAYGTKGQTTRFRMPQSLERSWQHAVAGVAGTVEAYDACAAMLAQVAAIATQYNMSLRDVAMHASAEYVDGDAGFVVLNQLDKMNDDMHVSTYRSVLDSMSPLERQRLFEQRPVTMHTRTDGSRMVRYDVGRDLDTEMARRLVQQYSRPPFSRVERLSSLPNLGPTSDDMLQELTKEQVVKNVVEPAEVGLSTDDTVGYGDWEPAEGGFKLTDEALRELRERPTNPYLAELDKYADWGKGRDETVVATFAYGSHVMGYENGIRACARCVTDAGLPFDPESGSNVGAANCDKCGHNEYNQSA